MYFPEHGEDLLERYYAGVEGNKDYFSMSCLASFNLLVSWIVDVATSIARNRTDNSFVVNERGLYAPEATPSKRALFMRFLEVIDLWSPFFSTPTNASHVF